MSAAVQTPTEKGDVAKSGTRLPGLLLGLVRAVRPRQWVKNLLVAAVPLAAGEIGDRHVIYHTALAFAAFTITASGVYLINDVRDMAEDRNHPTKQNRPIASGVVPPAVALVTGIVALTAGVVLGLVTLSPTFAAVVGGYAAISLAYCFWLKHEPVIDLGVIASGFLLRAMAGGVATELPMSVWFLMVASFGSLFIAAGKRYSEIHMAGPGNASTRRSLARYSASYLRFVWGLAASVTITTYGLWAFEMYDRTRLAWAPLSLAPFVLGLLRYAMDVDSGSAGAPEEIAFSDRALQGLGALWLVTVLVGVSS
ncbi:MAG TPA: decaprenyl-phosphate phosphoribosyltransferase [Micromonosporaceae bacterium]